MRKLLSLLFSFLIISANAKQISFNEASTIASEFLNSSVSKRKSAHVNVRAAQSKDSTLSNEEHQPYYVFNADNNEGFVIIAGDDRAKKILGYSPKGSFSYSHIPTQLNWMLDRYEKQMSNITKSSSTHPSWKTNTENSEIGDILLKTPEWGQGAPYNSQCPIINGVQAPTGCVATAIAIVMKYHNWPLKGYGMYDSYQDDIYPDYSQSGAFSFDWSRQSLNWDCENTDNFSSDIATNIYLIGKTFRTAYFIDNSYSDDVYRIGPKLHAFFNYSKDCQSISRNKWNNSDWYSLIRDQIDSGYPVIYFGKQEINSHAFVCDGYKDYLFHFNFGWDGLFNGYYALDVTDTDVQPFHDEEGVVINIIPDRHDDKCLLFTDPGYIWEYVFPELQTGEFYIIKHPNTQEDIWSSNNFHLYAPFAFNGKIGLALTDKTGKIKRIVNSFDVSNDFFRRKFEFSNFCLGDFVESDNLSIVYQQEGSEIWERVCGTIEAPTSISVNKGPAYVKLEWNIDSNISISQNTNYDCPPYRVLDLTNGMPDELPKNQIYYFRATVPQGYKGRVVKLYSSQDPDYHSYNIYENPKEIIFSVATPESGVIKIEKYQVDNELEINIDNQDDFYFDNWTFDEMASLKSLTVKGNIGFWEYLFIFNWCYGLETLNLSDANFYTSNCISYGGLKWLNYLELFYFPNNLERIIGTYTCKNLHQLKVIRLPENLKVIDGSFWDGNLPHLIICPCSNPPILENGPVFTTDITDSTTSYVENCKLLVPKGSRQIYLTTPEWKNFGEIEEYDNDWQQQVDEFLNKNRIRATAISINPTSISGEVGEKFSLTATITPSNAVNMPIEWSCSGDEAIVDNEGNVEIMKPGFCIITARTTDGSNITAQCAVNESATSNALELFEEDDKYYDIFDINGLIIQRQAKREDIIRLPSGFYLIGGERVYKK